jgi:hypothetical protein
MATIQRRDGLGRLGMPRGYRRPTGGRYDHPMLTKRLHHAGLRAWQLQLGSIGSIGLCIGLWIRAKTVDQDERGNAERRALFVGLWPPMFWLISDTLAQHE